MTSINTKSVQEGALKSIGSIFHLTRLKPLFTLILTFIFHYKETFDMEIYSRMAIRGYAA